MKLTAESFEEPFLITEIEVFSVGKSYQDQHFVANNIGNFSTESSIFIGFKQSASSVLFGTSNKIGPKEIIKKKGVPTKHETIGNREVISYDLVKIKIAGGEFDYHARYEFSKKKLKKFVLKITSANPGK